MSVKAVKKSTARPVKRKAGKRRSATPGEARIRNLIARELKPIKQEVAALRAELDALEDAAAIRIIENAPAEERFPASVAEALVHGLHPLKVFREYRGITQTRLAEAAGTSAAYISQIENGDREAGRKLLPKLADALDLDVEDLRC